MVKEKTVKTCDFSGYKHTAISLALAMVCLSSACSATGPTRRDALSQFRAENFLTLPLREGTDGFDRLDRALQGHFGANDDSSATNRIATQKPAMLRDGYVVRRYLRPDEERHMLVELSSEPCFPVKQAIAIARPDPSRMDYYQRTGLYTATGEGMSVGFSADGFKRDCVISLEIAGAPR